MRLILIVTFAAALTTLAAPLHNDAMQSAVANVAVRPRN